MLTLKTKQKLSMCLKLHLIMKRQISSTTSKRLFTITVHALEVCKPSVDSFIQRSFAALRLLPTPSPLELAAT